MPAPLLVFGWGNPSRGDDALGPLFVSRLGDALGASAVGRVDFLEDLQLQIEHALDLVGRSRVLFVDASRDAAAPYETRPIVATPAVGSSSHALAPQTLLRVFRELHGHEAPYTTLLAIRGTGFELGQPLSDPAASHLEQALAWGLRWVAGE